MAAPGKADIFVCQFDLAALEEVASFSSDGDHFGLLCRILPQERLRSLDNVGVECTGKALVGRDQNDEVFFVTASVEQRMRKIISDLCAQSAENLGHLARKRTRCRNAVLCAF